MQRFIQSACMVLALGAGTLPAVAQSFSGKGIVLWDHTAFGQANQSPSPAWDEFKTFIQSTDTGLGGTIYKDCSDGYFVHYTPSTATAMVDLAQLSPPVKVALGAAMVSCQASAGDACGVTDAQAISTFIQNLSQHDVNALSPVYGGYVDLWLDFEPHDVNLMSFYMGNLQSIRNIVDAHNTAAGSTGLKLRLVPFISNGLHLAPFTSSACTPQDGSQTAYYADCIQEHYADQVVLMAYRNISCYQDSDPTCHPSSSGTPCVDFWNSTNGSMSGGDGLTPWSVLFARGAQSSNTTFAFAIETNPAVGSAWKISFGQPNIYGNIGYLDSQVGLTVDALDHEGLTSSIAPTSVIVHDYTHFYCFMRGQMPTGISGSCPSGTATNCNPLTDYLPEDLNGDGVVDADDLAVMYARLGTCPGDLDLDGVVDGADLGLMLSMWGQCLP